MKKNTFLIGVVVFVLVIGLALIGRTAPPTGSITVAKAPPQGEIPKSIKIAAVRSLSGPLKVFEDTAMGPIYKLWRHQVNEVDGGIYVEKYGKKLPVDIDVRDDASEMNTMVTLLTQMVESGDYPFVIGPDCTPFLQAAGPICSQHKSILVGAEGGATTVAKSIHQYPYMFSNLNFSNWNQVAELSKLLDSWQAYHKPDKIKVYILHIDDLFGYEYTDSFLNAVDKYDSIKVLKKVAVPPFTTEVGAQVQEASKLGADVLCLFAYPPTPQAAVGYASSVGINFNAVVTGPAACYEGFYDPALNGFGEAAIGVSGFGAWNEYSSPALRDFAKAFIDFHGRGLMDWWGGAYYYAGLDMLAQAIKKAGSLDPTEVREVMASEKLQTILGETWYTDYEGNWPIGNSGGLLAIGCHPGEFGQWQKVEAPYWGGTKAKPRAKPYGISGKEWAVFEVLDLNDHQTAKAVYPKPNWPKK